MKLIMNFYLKLLNKKESKMCYNGQRPVIDVQVCVQCEKCCEACPGHSDVWYWTANMEYLLPDILACCNTSCNGECWNVCPVCALGEHSC